MNAERYIGKVFGQREGIVAGFVEHQIDHRFQLGGGSVLGADGGKTVVLRREAGGTGER